MNEAPGARQSREGTEPAGENQFPSVPPKNQKGAFCSFLVFSNQMEGIEVGECLTQNRGRVYASITPSTAEKDTFSAVLFYPLR